MLRTVAALLLLTSMVSAQTTSIEYVQTMHDKIPLYGTQGEPALVIDAGQTVEITDERTELDVLVRGALRLLPGGHLKARTITMVNGGTIEIIEPATITIRNMPINTEMDPSQFGHGLLVVNGTIKTTAPSWRQAFCQVAAELKAGDTTVSLASIPRGWKAGDTLIVPDTRRPVAGGGGVLSELTERVTIASITGPTVTLSAPLVNDHLGWHKQDGSLGMLFDVQNLTQPIIIRSENPMGVRGHVFVTASSHQDVEGVALVEMGRTTSAPLHSTLRDDQGNIAQIGTNQIGRYAWHHHHLLGVRNNGLPWQFRLENYSVDGSPKWGVAVHGSHFGLVNNGAIFNCAGCGIVTEDPWAYGNKITNNIVIAKQPGSGQRITERAHRNLAGGDHWHDRGGLGLESAMNEITGNRLYCCKESIGMAGFGTSSLYYPKERGVCTCLGKSDPNAVSISGLTTLNDKIYPIMFDTSGNRAWGGWRGFETWTANSSPETVIASERSLKNGWVPPEKRTIKPFFPGYEIVHCALPTDFQDQTETHLTRWTILGDWKFSSWITNPSVDAATGFLYGLDWKGGYRFGITLDDVTVRGYDVAYRGSLDDFYVNFNRCKFECPIIMYFPNGQYRAIGPEPVDYVWTDCEFLPVNGKVLALSGKYPKYDLKLWLGAGTHAAGTRTERRSLARQTYQFRPWRDGRDLDAYHYEQLPTFELPPISADKQYGDWPPGVNTHKQLIELGTPIFGAAVPTTAFQSEDFGKFWANDVTPSCEVRLQRALDELKALKAQQ